MKPFAIERLDYAEASAFVRRHHRHLPVPPPSQQVAWCAGVVWQRRLRAVVMVGQPVAPSLARSHYEVRRLASDGLWGACSALYRWAVQLVRERGRALVTYTLASESGRSLEASGARRVSETPGGIDRRPGRTNRLAGVTKVRWEW